MPLLPIRARALHFLSTVDKANIQEVMAGLENEYGKERQFTEKNFVDHMMSLQANELIDEVGYKLDDTKTKLVIDYKINDEGVNTINKFLPKKWRNQ